MHYTTTRKLLKTAGIRLVQSPPAHGWDRIWSWKSEVIALHFVSYF